MTARNLTDDARPLRLSISLYDGSGAQVASVEPGAQWLLGGAAATEQVDLTRLPAGSYRVVLVARVGDEWFGAQHSWEREADPTVLIRAA